jgi:integrase
MATITRVARKNGAVAYKARVRRQGQSQLSKTFPTKADAVAWSKKIEVEIAQEHAGLVPAGMQVTLNQLIDKFIDERFSEFAPSTLPSYRTALKFWQAKFGSRKAAEITPKMVADVQAELKAGPSAAAYVNRKLEILSAVYTQACKAGYLADSNPVQKVVKAPDNNSRKIFITKHELAALIAAAKTTRNPELPLIVTLAATTGMRRGEITGLRWSMINLDKATITLPTSKTSKGRTVALAPGVVAALAELKARAKVVAISGAGKVFARPNFTKAWKSCTKKAGLDDLHFHDLRHSAASFLASAGANLLEIGAVLGHNSTQTTARYAHLVESHTHDMMKAVAADVLGDEG